MASVRKTAMPESGLLATYTQRADCYVDCYYVDIPGQIELSTYVENFFSTWLMRLERRMIGKMGSKQSNDTDVQSLAGGDSDYLAWWRVEEREPDQLLLSVSEIATLTWLMVEKSPGPNLKTRLYFGSAVLKPSFVSRILLPFHKIYSRMLLRSASKECERISH